MPEPYIVRLDMNIENLRKAYHKEICRRILGLRSGIPNIADVSSKTSNMLASGLVKRLDFPLCKSPPVGQTVGTVFAELTMHFLNEAFSLLYHLRPGKWIFSASQASIGIAAFDQYEHLAALDTALKSHKELAAARLASLAMGTGDIDCVYHMALPELKSSVKESENEDQWDMLDTLITGKRLRDISDLPFDLVS